MRRHGQVLLILGFTAVFVGYLSLWLRGPGVGLSFLGIELGEWFKFLGFGARRDLFYLPPITLGLMLAIWTITWPWQERSGWRAWLVRALAVLVSLLAFPAVEDMMGPLREQYLLRVAGVLLVGALALVGAWFPRRSGTRLWPWWALLLLGLVAATLPAWLFLQAQTLLSGILGVPVGTGIGLWLNGLGNGLVVAVALYQLLAGSPLQQPPA